MFVLPLCVSFGDFFLINGQPLDESSLSSELLVLNLPVGKDVAQVKNRLKKLSDNCGGKVLRMSGGTAILKFPNPASATR